MSSAGQLWCLSAQGPLAAQFTRGCSLRQGLHLLAWMKPPGSPASWTCSLCPEHFVKQDFRFLAWLYLVGLILHEKCLNELP